LLKLEDARAEVVSRINLICGFKIDEGLLTPQMRQSITSIATAFRQLVVIKDLLMVEKASYGSLGSRMARGFGGDKMEAKEIADYVSQIGKLQKDLDSRMEDAATRASQEMAARWGAPVSPGAAPVAEHVMIEELTCKKCGASLKIPTGRIAKCDYCGTEYALSEYLDRLGASIKG
jgi:hypothetical protein